MCPRVSTIWFTTFVLYVIFHWHSFLKHCRHLTNKNWEDVFLKKAANSSTRYHHVIEKILLRLVGRERQRRKGKLHTTICVCCSPPSSSTLQNKIPYSKRYLPTRKQEAKRLSITGVLHTENFHPFSPLQSIKKKKRKKN